MGPVAVACSEKSKCLQSANMHSQGWLGPIPIRPASVLLLWVLWCRSKLSCYLLPSLLCHIHLCLPVLWQSFVNFKSHSFFSLSGITELSWGLPVWERGRYSEEAPACVSTFALSFHTLGCCQLVDIFSSSLKTFWLVDCCSDTVSVWLWCLGLLALTSCCHSLSNYFSFKIVIEKT